MLFLDHVYHTETVKKPKSYAATLKTLAMNIKICRKAAGFTQEDMADRGFNYRHYQKIESGKYSPSFQTIHRLSEIFDVSVSDLTKGC